MGALVTLLTLSETAERLRKSEAQLRWMIHTKTAPPSAIIGGRRMFRAHDVDSWIDAQFAKEAASA
ncbi:helix-turn-helix transcriptional regulator [Leifsonia virtsii]|uniref:Helix-turn-helix domain-containing protein n=1 Tax=Leifsonia virtsii TaxID=3035915 RepID=A0ABT8ISY4_9MICO|nr:helix-turn-helix domain-containing protein [Leifsonia virtsii]MDN4595911.1 helix-turn-helix domain-containing protein [Leifsonia virtsii]